MNSKLCCLFVISLVTICFAENCTSKDLVFDFSVLNAQATEESLVPIRPGIPGKRPFWNGHSRRFIWVPAFDFKPIDGAVTYRFTATSRVDNKDYCFTAKQPWVPLTPIWQQLPVGPVVLTVEALDDRGREVQMICRGRKLYRAAAFNGPYHKPAMDYRQSALQALKYLFNAKHIKRWAEDGQPDPSYNLYCYPSKVIGAVVRTMALYSKLSPEDAEQALLIARAAADYLISKSEPPGAPLEYFPPTYEGQAHAAGRNKGKIMVTTSAEPAIAYLDLYDATKETKYLTAAKRIADTYVTLQLPCGTWPAMVDMKTGKSIAANLSMPTMWIIPFLERLEKQYGLSEYRKPKEKAFRWVMENPMKTFNWDGQFEDQILAPDYDNLTSIDACYHAIYLLKHSEDNPEYIQQAQELLRFAEDQFVVWEKIMPKEYRRRKNLGYARFLLPCALEQYHYMDSIDAVAAIMIKAYSKAYEVTGTELYLAKACALANSMTVAQELNKKLAPGRYPTAWRKQYTSQDLLYNWINCMAMDIEAMLGLAETLKGRK